MSGTLRFFLLAAVCGALAISTFSVANVVVAQVTPVQHALQTGEKAYAELKAADMAGGNITGLALRFNAALALWQNASRVEKIGEPGTASQLASEADNSFQAIISDAQNLHDAAVLRHEQDAAFRRIAIPAAAVIVAILAVAAMVIYRRIRSRQFAELSVRVKARD